MLNTSPKSELIASFIYFSIFAYTFLPSKTPSNITFKLFSSKIMSLDSFAMSAPVFTQIPTSAECKEAASFTPSPIYPTTCPFFLNTFTILSFCIGFILANIFISSTFLLNSSSVIFSKSEPSKTSPSIPTKPHIFSVAYWLSPVITFVCIPYFFNSFIVCFTSFFGGSKNPTNPIKVMFFSSFSLNIFTPEYSFLLAIAITCIPFLANSFAFSSIFSIFSFVIFWISPLLFTFVQIFKISSNAPFVINV